MKSSFFLLTALAAAFLVANLSSKYLLVRVDEDLKSKIPGEIIHLIYFKFTIIRIPWYIDILRMIWFSFHYLGDVETELTPPEPRPSKFNQLVKNLTLEEKEVIAETKRKHTYLPE